MNYYWADLIDGYIRMNKDNVKAYTLPNTNSTIDAIYTIGDPIQIYSYVVVGGRLWIMYDNDITGRMNYIPLTGNPGDGIIVSQNTINSVFYNPPIFTVEEQEAQEEQAAAGPFDSVITAIKGVGTVLLIGYVINLARGNN